MLFACVFFRGRIDERQQDDANLNRYAGDKGHKGVEFDKLQINGKQKCPAQAGREDQREQPLAPFYVEVDPDGDGEGNGPDENEPVLPMEEYAQPCVADDGEVPDANNAQ